jgi:hypothetical protein
MDADGWARAQTFEANKRAECSRFGVEATAHVQLCGCQIGCQGAIAVEVRRHSKEFSALWLNCGLSAANNFSSRDRTQARPRFGSALAPRFDAV